MSRNLIPCLLVSVYLTGVARGQHREFAIGAGYGHLFWDGAHTAALEEQGGVRFEGRVSWPVSEPMTDTRPELRLGVGLGVAVYYSEHGGDIFEEDGILFVDPEDFEQLTTLEPEIQFSLRVPVGSDYYLEPGIAGTFIAGNYRTGEDFVGFIDEDVNRWRVGGGGRLILRGAYHRERWSFGIEGSYAYGWLDFGDDIGGDIQQGYLGVFYAHRF
jgi:hypothetical protein